jgi:LmbE family N-acetylglucosaminyl deacetylase
MAWKARHKRWLDFVQGTVKAMQAGKPIPIGPSKTRFTPPPVSASPSRPLKVALCAPHPDDEALIGALPLRLRIEVGARVTDYAITLGSNTAERSRRLRELESACGVLGFELIVPNPPWGFDRVNVGNRDQRRDEWVTKVQELADIFEREQPDVVFAPHAEDHNTTHVGTHFLVVDALGIYLERNARGPLPLIETEFWHQHAQPNLMVGISSQVVAIQLMATAEHGGEVKRNPYHLRQPARMMDNVRRGSEVIGGQGGPASSFAFGELYRVTFMKGKVHVLPRPGGRIVGPDEEFDFDSLVKEFWPLAE